MSFDDVINRVGTNSSKWDLMERAFGVPADDGIAMWIADMDFAAPDFLQNATQGLIEKANYGYFCGLESFHEAVNWWMETRHGWRVDPSWTFITYGLGHGIGLYIHMPPVLSPSSDGVLFQSSDMAITIEPGIYLTGRWGVRVEDDVMVTRGGSQLITHFPKSLEDAILLPEGYTNNTLNTSTTTSKHKQGINYLTILGPVIVLGVILMIALVLKKKKK